MRVSHLHRIAASSRLEVHEPQLATRLIARATGTAETADGRDDRALLLSSLQRVAVGAEEAKFVAVEAET